MTIIEKLKADPDSLIGTDGTAKYVKTINADKSIEMWFIVGDFGNITDRAPAGSVLTDRWCLFENHKFIKSTSGVWEHLGYSSYIKNLEELIAESSSK